MKKRKPETRLKCVDIPTLMAVLSYDADAGSLTWRTPGTVTPDMDQRIIDYAMPRAGKNVATMNMGDGHRGIMICRTVFVAARIIWAISYGYWPLRVNFNGKKADLRLQNMTADRLAPPRRLRNINPVTRK